MMTGKMKWLVGASLLAAATSGCTVPMILVDQAFLGETRTAKIVMQRSAEGQFNQFLRICTLNQNGQEVDCKDTLVLENVIAGSLY